MKFDNFISIHTNKSLIQVFDPVEKRTPRQIKQEERKKELEILEKQLQLQFIEELSEQFSSSRLLRVSSDSDIEDEEIHKEEEDLVLTKETSAIYSNVSSQTPSHSKLPSHSNSSSSSKVGKKDSLDVSNKTLNGSHTSHASRKRVSKRQSTLQNQNELKLDESMKKLAQQLNQWSDVLTPQTLSSEQELTEKVDYEKIFRNSGISKILRDELGLDQNPKAILLSPYSRRNSRIDTKEEHNKNIKIEILKNSKLLANKNQINSRRNALIKENVSETTKILLDFEMEKTIAQDWQHSQKDLLPPQLLELTMEKKKTKLEKNLRPNLEVKKYAIEAQKTVDKKKDEEFLKKIKSKELLDLIANSKSRIRYLVQVKV